MHANAAITFCGTSYYYFLLFSAFCCKECSVICLFDGLSVCMKRSRVRSNCSVAIAMLLETVQNAKKCAWVQL